MDKMQKTQMATKRQKHQTLNHLKFKVNRFSNNNSNNNITSNSDQPTACESDVK